MISTASIEVTESFLQAVFSLKIEEDIPSVWDKYTTSVPILLNSCSYFIQASVPCQSLPTKTTSQPKFLIATNLSL